MKKELSEMTLEELWELFPIFLVQHDEKWSQYYMEIEDLLQKALVDYPIDKNQSYRKHCYKGNMGERYC